MKKILFLFLSICLSVVSYADDTNYLGTHRIAINRARCNTHNHYIQPIDCPDVLYNSINNHITIDFGIQPVNNYTVTISSLYADVDYYATSSFTTIPLAVDGTSDYSIVIETADGDVFEGTLYASQYVTSQTM